LLEAPEIEFEFQQPSYIKQVSENIFLCDSERDECRVNLDFRSSFIDGFSESDYICEVDFDFWYETGEENKCNPNTITIPQWQQKFRIKIYHENNKDIYSEQILEFHNIVQIVQNSISWWSSSSSWNIFIFTLNSPSGKVTVFGLHLPSCPVTVHIPKSILHM